MIKIIWTSSAFEDLENIHAFIARDAEIYADAVLLEIFRAVDQLKKFPKSGRKVPEQDDVNVRELIVGNYRIIHEIASDTIQILAVLHCARLFPETG